MCCLFSCMVVAVVVDVLVVCSVILACVLVVLVVSVVLVLVFFVGVDVVASVVVVVVIVVVVVGIAIDVVTVVVFVIIVRDIVPVLVIDRGRVGGAGSGNGTDSGFGSRVDWGVTDRCDKCVSYITLHVTNSHLQGPRKRLDVATNNNLVDPITTWASLQCLKHRMQSIAIVYALNAIVQCSECNSSWLNYCSMQ